MLQGIGMLALASLAVAIPQPVAIPENMRQQLESLPMAIDYGRHMFSREEEPCKIVAEAYKAAKIDPTTGGYIDVAPSTGIACLKSVPLEKERDLDLLEKLQPFVEFQSNLDILKDPPKEYLLPKVDFLGSLDKIKRKVKNAAYKSQFEQQFGFVALSSNGIRVPEIFMFNDMWRGNHNALGYHPSAVSNVDGVPITKWIEDSAMLAVASQDPDTMFNRRTYSVPLISNSGTLGNKTRTWLEIPDSHTITFRNGTRREYKNKVWIQAGPDLTKIKAGDDLHTAIEVPASTTTTETAEPTTTETEEEEEPPYILGRYPNPEVQHSLGSISGYFLNGSKYNDTAVLSLLNFLPTQTTTFDVTNFTAEYTQVLSDFIELAKKHNREKLIIDLSANGGGSILASQSVYHFLFPDGEFDAFDRWRINPFLDIASEIDTELLLGLIAGPIVNPNGKNVTTREQWFGPDTLKNGQKMTNPFQTHPKVLSRYFSQFGDFKEAAFKPENILIVTDGICASACTILVGLLKRNYNIRTLSLGGRPSDLPMQAIGGVRGSRTLKGTEISAYVTGMEDGLKDDKKGLTTLEDAGDKIPTTKEFPLLSAGLGLNVYDAYSKDDIDGYPLHFHYEAANCRLFYTQQMVHNIAESWQRAADVAWHDASCVPGSTTDSDGKIGDDTKKYDSRVRSNGKAIPAVV